MISAGRILGLAAAGAVLLGLLGINTAATPASAQQVCKDDRVEAKSEIRAFLNAENEAKSQWEKLAQEQFGERFSKWANAKDANVECEDAKSPKLGLNAKVCTATGRPCSSDDREVVREREADKTGRRRDARTRDRDRSGSRDDWYSRRVQRAYDAEMRYQDYLAKRRRQAEKWAYQREMAYWRRLHRRWAYGWD